MRNVHAQSLSERSTEWFHNLANSPKELRRTAEQLYCGTSWAPVSNLLKRGDARIWIISAGQGLLTPKTSIPSYSATFAPRNPDSIVPAATQPFTPAQWWEKCIEHRKGSQDTTSLTELARQFPTTPLLVAVSQDYFNAVTNDLLTARQELSDPDLLIIVSSGAKKTGALNLNLIPCDSRMEHIVGKGRTALNARLALEIIRTYPDDLSSSVLSKKMQRLQDSLPPSTYPLRERTTSEEVLQFIRQHIATTHNHSHSSLLALFRSTGRACEQSRFRNLYLSAINNNQ